MSNSWPGIPKKYIYKAKTTHWFPDELKWFDDLKRIQEKLKNLLNKKENSFISITGYLCTINDNKYVYKAIYVDKDTHEKENITVYLYKKDHELLQSCPWMFN